MLGISKGMLVTALIAAAVVVGMLYVNPIREALALPPR